MESLGFSHAVRGQPLSASSDTDWHTLLRRAAVTGKQRRTYWISTVLTARS